MKSSLAVAAARNAISQRDVAGTILHSDRGSQAVFNRSKNDGITGSMGRVSVQRQRRVKPLTHRVN